MEPTMSDDLIVHMNRPVAIFMLVMVIIGALFILFFVVFLLILMVIHPQQRDRGTVYALVVALGFGALCL